MELTERQIKNFWAKVDRKGKDECWLWQAATDRRGYGLISFNNKMYRAPRISLLLYTGELPCPEHDACHSCDTPACVNPRHLTGCTRSENMIDAAKKGRLYNNSQKQKLIPSQVRKIRRMKGQYKDIASKFNLDASTVSKIKSRSIWKYLPD